VAETDRSCDLHVHSIYSGPVDLPLLGRFGNECYSEPKEVYFSARRRGMTLFTLTDHDSIEGVLRLCARDDVFVSEELTLELPGGRRLHLGVFGLDQRRHEGLQARRRDPEALFAFLAEQRLPAAVNHLFSALTGARERDDITLALGQVGLVETRNAMMPPTTNEWARKAARVVSARSIGGSDAHTLASVARAFTIVPGARTRDEFLDGLRHGCTIPMGRSGSYARLTADVAQIFALGYVDSARRGKAELGSTARFVAMLAALPLLPLLPVVTAALWARELAFGRRHYRRFEEILPRRLRPRDISKRLGPPALRPAMT
jgi:predicted metal-dependent phosphoesterase TrpH